ncbi:MAG: hypothetical protein AB1894_04615 [Chloroflexota bacterium]
MINYVIWLIAGAAIGSLAALILRDRKALLRNVFLGIVGVILSGYLLAPLLHLGTINQQDFNFPALLVALVVTMVLLAIANSVRFFRNRPVSKAVLESKWVQVRSQVGTRWNKLSKEDVDEIDGKYDRFIAVIQKRYGCGREQAEEQLQGYLKAITRKA